MSLNIYPEHFFQTERKINTFKLKKQIISAFIFRKLYPKSFFNNLFAQNFIKQTIGTKIMKIKSKKAKTYVSFVCLFLTFESNKNKLFLHGKIIYLIINKWTTAAENITPPLSRQYISLCCMFFCNRWLIFHLLCTIIITTPIGWPMDGLALFRLLQ